MTKAWNQQSSKQPLAPTVGDAVPKRGNWLTKAIACFFLQKTVIIHPPLKLTGQIEQDIQQLQSYYKDAIGKHAEKF